MDQDLTSPGQEANSDTELRHAQNQGVAGERSVASPPQHHAYPYAHSFWQEVLAAHQLGPCLSGDDFSAKTTEAAREAEQSPSWTLLAGLANVRGLPVRYVFRHSPTTLNTKGIAQAWRETLMEEASLQQQLSPNLFEQTAEVLTLNAEGWPLFFSERRDISFQTMQSLVTLLSYSAHDIDRLRAHYQQTGRSLEQLAASAADGESDRGDETGLTGAFALPCRLVIVEGPPAYSGILLIAQQCLCDSQTLQYILVRFWRRYQGLPKLLPQWSDCFPTPDEASSALNYWHELLVNARFTPLPCDVRTEDPAAQAETGEALCDLSPPVFTSAKFVSEEQWRLIQQASAVLGVDVESVMLSAFARWLMLVTRSDAALFGVLSVRSPTAPISPPELKPFSVQADADVSATQWVQSISNQLRASRLHPMPHLAELANTAGQTPYCLAQLLLEAIFCFEYIQVDWPEALAPITSFGNANGQLGTHGRLQLTIDITDERMRVVWWGAANAISQAQLLAFEKSFEHTLMDLLRAVLQFNQWSRVDPRRKQQIALTETLPSLEQVADDNFLQSLWRDVLEAPKTCLIATEQQALSRETAWVAAAMFAHEVLKGHPQFVAKEQHHPVLVLAEDPIEIVLLLIAAQMCALVPLITSVDARRTILGDARHPAWARCRQEWLLTTRAVANEASEHAVVVPVTVTQLLSRAERFLAICTQEAISEMPWQTATTPSFLDIPQSCASLWRSLHDFFQGEVFQRAAAAPNDAPVFGYFDPISSVQCQQRIVTHSHYWACQARYLAGLGDKSGDKGGDKDSGKGDDKTSDAPEGRAAQRSKLTGQTKRVMLVGQALDHAGLWPCMGALFAGLPLLWVVPESLLALVPNGRQPLPRGIADFLDDESPPAMPDQTDDQARSAVPWRQLIHPPSARLQTPTLDRVERATRVVANAIDAPEVDASNRPGQSLCFLPELCYGMLVTERRLEGVFRALDARVDWYLVGEGRLRLPASLGGLPPILMSVCERESANAPVYHAGDTYTSAGRVLLGFVVPVRAAPPNTGSKSIGCKSVNSGGNVGPQHRKIKEEVTYHDALELTALLPDVYAFAAGSQRGSLDYARCTLRIHIDGAWAVDPPEHASDLCLYQPGNCGPLRWELASTVMLRGRQHPLLEPEDTQFSPGGAWSAACRFWERIVTAYVQSCWTKVRPESQTLGQASVRILPFDSQGIPVQSHSEMMPFAQSAAAWARLHTPAGRHWGVGVTPRWDEIFGPKPHTAATPPPLAQSMTLARLTERILNLPQTPKVSQTWVELGGDWFALFRLTFVLRRLGWTWTLPIRSLHQPLGRFALQLARLERVTGLPLSHLRAQASGPSPGYEENSSVPTIVPTVMPATVPRAPVVNSRVGSRVVASSYLSAYQLGTFRRYPQSLAHQVHRLQFYYSGTVRLSQLRAALNRWVALFPALRAYFELTGQGMQQRVLYEGDDPSDVLTDPSAMPGSAVAQAGSGDQSSETQRENQQSHHWSDLLDQALDYQTEPFQSAYLEKLRLEENAGQMQLNTPPLWRCVVYPKGQGRWSVWLMAHKLLFDTREWLDSIRCLELLLFEAMDDNQVLPWLDTQVASLRSIDTAAPRHALAGGQLHDRALPEHVQAGVARFWQDRMDGPCQPLVPGHSVGHRGENRWKTIVQPLPESLNGVHWQQLVALTGVDRLTLLLWAVSQSLMRFQGVSGLRLDLDAPWSVMGAQAPEILTGQCGPVPLFLQYTRVTSFSLLEFKQQVYEQLLAPNPESLLVPGSLAYEQFYDALYAQDTCFSYLESLPENTELTSLADIEQIRRLFPSDFLESSGGYHLKIEAFPSRARYVLVWRFNESVLSVPTVEAFVGSVASLLNQTIKPWLGDLGLVELGGMEPGSNGLSTDTRARDARHTDDQQQAHYPHHDQHHAVKSVPEMRARVQQRYVCPIDFGLSGVDESSWVPFLRQFPKLEEMWQLPAVNAWAFQTALHNPLAQCRGSQATRCPYLPVDAFRKRLYSLSLLVPEIAARWAILADGTMALIKAENLKVVVREATSRTLWEALPPLAHLRDEQDLLLPCVFTIWRSAQRTMLVRCDYDLRALEPGLVSAVLSTLAAGSLKPIKSTLHKLWLANSGLGLSRAARMKLRANSNLRRSVVRQDGSTAHGGAAAACVSPYEAYDQIRAAYWRHCFAPLVGAPELRAWLPMTDALTHYRPRGQGTAHDEAQREESAEPELAGDTGSPKTRDTTFNIVSDQQCSLVDPLQALVCVLQNIRRYLVRLWGDRLWIVHLLFADRQSLAQAGLAEDWAQHPHTSPHCWMPVFLGNGHVAASDSEQLLHQLRCSAQHPLEGEAELTRWLGWSSETISGIALVVAAGEAGCAALQDWHRLQLAPLQFQWNPHEAATLRMSVQEGIDMTPIGQQGALQTDLDIMASQAAHFNGVTRAQGRRLDLSRVVGEFASLRENAAQEPRGKPVRRFVILDVQLAQFPQQPGTIAHHIQNFLADRLNTALLPDLVRICDDQMWGESACYAWLERLHGSYQSQLKQRLTSLLFRSQPAVTSAALGDHRSWFWPVSEALPGWQSERARASLLATPPDIGADTLSVRALRTLHHWAQWSAGGRAVLKQRPLLAERRWELTPDQACWLATASPNAAFFNAQLLLSFPSVAVEALYEALTDLVKGDPIFRLQFSPPEEDKAQTASEGTPAVGLQGFSAMPDEDLVAAVIKRITIPIENVEQTQDAITRVTQEWQSCFALSSAPLLRLLLFDCGGYRGPYVAILGSRLAVDRHGVKQLALRLDARLAGRACTAHRSWQQWLAFLAQQRNQVRQLPAVSRLFAAGVRHGEDSLYEHASAVLGHSREQLMRSEFAHRHVRRQFLPVITAEQASGLFGGDLAMQDLRAVLCLACLGLTFGRWLNLPEVVVGQWWPVRDDPRAQHWREVVGTFEFVFKNKILLMNDSPLATAQRLGQYAPSALQDAISGALAKEDFDYLDAFSLFSFERIDDQLSVPQLKHCEVVQQSLGAPVHGANQRRSLIRIEAAFGTGQLDLRWVYDRKLVNVSFIESLVTRFAFYWTVLRRELQSYAQQAACVKRERHQDVMRAPAPNPQADAPVSTRPKPNRPAGAARPNPPERCAGKNPNRVAKALSAEGDRVHPVKTRLGAQNLDADEAFLDESLASTPVYDRLPADGTEDAQASPGLTNRSVSCSVDEEESI